MSNMRTLRLLLLSCIGVLLVASPALADKGIAQRFDWVSKWGNILPETGIPVSKFGPKMDILNAVTNCGIGDTNYSKIGSYGVDFNGDGHADIVTEARGYFQQGYNKNTCPFDICTSARGCNISVYRHVAISQVITAPKAGPKTACPAKAADNTTCRSDCPATVENCPALFDYITGLEFDGLVFDWSFLTAADFSSSIKASRVRSNGTPKYRAPFNSNPVFVQQRLSGHCTLEEMDVNNNNVVESNEPCVKYLQYTNGHFTDLYLPGGYTSTDEKDERLTTALFDCSKARIKEAAPSEPTSCLNAGATYNSDWRMQEQALRLPSQSASETGVYAYQIANYSDPANEAGMAGFVCKEVRNTSGRDVLVPQRTDLELAAFQKAVAVGNLPGVTVNECSRRFTSWSGQLECPPLSCDEVRTISATRNCQRSTSSMAPCGECSSIADPQPISGFENQCSYSAVCMGPPCPPPSGSGDGGDCLSPESFVLMADGKLKSIEHVSVGDKVMGFDKNAPLGALHPATVKSIMATDKTPMISINGIKASPNHVLTLDSGRSVRAGHIQPGMKLVGTSGQEVPVISAHAVEQQPSYNLDIDGADGFVAEGIRVMEQPMQ